MTQIGRYAHSLNVNITKIRAHIEAHFQVEGSILNDSIQGGCASIETDYQVESPDDPAKVAAVLRNARSGCFIRQAVAHGVPFEDKLSVNGEAFDMYAYPALEAGAARS